MIVTLHSPVAREANKSTNMACKTYRLYATTTAASSSDVAHVRMSIPGNGLGSIKAVAWTLSATGGAGVGIQTWQLSRNNALQSTNDAQNTISHCQIATGNATTAVSNQMVVHDCPVKDGDYVYLHSGIQSGTAPAGATQFVDVIVEQPGA